MHRTKEPKRRASNEIAGRSYEGESILAPAVTSETERDTLQLRVYRALARGLMVGMFEPGEAVTLRTLAIRLGTSAMPVREAVSRLIAERALVLLPNRSVIVPRMSRKRFVELSQTRQILEGNVTEAACEHANSALLRRLSEINVDMKRCIETGNLRDALSHNCDFHFTLYRSSGRKVMFPLIEMLWLQAGPFLALSLTIPGVHWTARHHKATLVALRARLGSSARRAIEDDIEETSVQLLKKANFEDSTISKEARTRLPPLALGEPKVGKLRASNLDV